MESLNENIIPQQTQDRLGGRAQPDPGALAGPLKSTSLPLLQVSAAWTSAALEQHEDERGEAAGENASLGKK